MNCYLVIATSWPYSKRPDSHLFVATGMHHAKFYSSASGSPRIAEEGSGGRC